ncbi:MAG: hypothetical protein PHV06_06955 [bacterium]|nr:hypothetical protein [bacterium]
MGKYEEIIEIIKGNLLKPNEKKESNHDLLKSAIAAFSKDKAKIVKEFEKEDKFLVIIWEFDNKYYVSNINQFFIEFDKYKFNDKNAAFFLYKDLTAFSEELFEIES